MEAVELDFLERAEKVYVFERIVRFPVEAVWPVFVDPLSWPSWWPQVRQARYESPERGRLDSGRRSQSRLGLGSPQGPGVGWRRYAEVAGQRYDETMLAWEDQRRWAYRIDRASVPIARAQVESTEFERLGSRTRLTWTLAMDRRLLMLAMSPILPGKLDRLFATAVSNLEGFIAAQRT